jgi:hypothetical protein
MEMIFESSKSVVLLNLVPPCWIDYKHRLKKGDHMPPYRFLSEGEVLHQLIRHTAGIQWRSLVLSVL